MTGIKSGVAHENLNPGCPAKFCRGIRHCTQNLDIKMECPQWEGIVNGAAAIWLLNGGERS
jgi:hypothetical protein